jgi:hypothetical protein
MSMVNISGKVGEVGQTSEEENPSNRRRSSTDDDSAQKLEGKANFMSGTDFASKNVHPDKIDEEKFEMMGTTRNDYTNEYYKHVCSEIVEDFIYLGGDKVASNLKTL